jgi:hypothetical protein
MKIYVMHLDKRSNADRGISLGQKLYKYGRIKDPVCRRFQCFSGF